MYVSCGIYDIDHTLTTYVFDRNQIRMKKNRVSVVLFTHKKQGKGFFINKQMLQWYCPTGYF